MPPDESDDEVPESIEVPVTDLLDLHHFAPREVAALVTHYIEEAQALGLGEVRLVHGKGTGQLRQTVHRVLEKHPAVERYRLADESAGGWGATLVTLRSPEEKG